MTECNACDYPVAIPGRGRPCARACCRRPSLLNLRDRFSKNLLIDTAQIRHILLALLVAINTAFYKETEAPEILAKLTNYAKLQLSLIAYLYIYLHGALSTFNVL